MMQKSLEQLNLHPPSTPGCVVTVTVGTHELGSETAVEVGHARSGRPSMMYEVAMQPVGHALLHPREV